MRQQLCRCVAPAAPAPPLTALLPHAHLAAHLAARMPSPCSQDAIRGATYDLLSGRPREHFAHEPPHAFATLSQHDRDNIRAKLGLARG